MEVIFEGSLSGACGIKDVLQAVRNADAVNDHRFGILRVSAADSEPSGKLVVADGRFIVGAALSDGSECGYEAIRRLLSLQDGSYAFLDAGSRRPAEFDETLCLSIDKVVECLPSLPEKQAELFDEKSLLDKVFGADPLDETGSGTATTRPSARVPATQGLPVQAAAPAASKGVWTFMQPLINSASTSATDAPAFDFEDTSAARTSLSKLREQGAGESTPWYKELFREALFSRQAILWISVIFVTSLVITLIAGSALNQNNSPKQHNSLTIQKGATTHH